MWTLGVGLLASVLGWMRRHVSPGIWYKNGSAPAVAGQERRDAELHAYGRASAEVWQDQACGHKCGEFNPHPSYGIVAVPARGQGRMVCYVLGVHYTVGGPCMLSKVDGRSYVT